MAIDVKEIISFLKDEQNKNFLSENGFQTEKTIEVPAKITDVDVQKYISDNQGFRDKLHNQIETDFLKRKTGLEEIKPEMLGEKLHLDSSIKANSESYKKALIEANLSGAKHPDLLMKMVDVSKVEFKEGKLEGFNEQYESFKTQYPDMFETTKIQPRDIPKSGGETPPAPLTYEKFSTMSKAERKNVSNADLERLAKE